ncbi:MAG: MoaD/ThiS family protein [Candidatus Bathyarchaeota archaeon]|jgi:molybdopterin synthase sulfur carrier subunit|nr:MoaD/ThiS family protein [Candidatus Bathyarchaeota archaeon A05DMB-5]MDH7557386.1 MoaD/ThiS family protein [Candidatus Bathyarchaeota archaeon]
MAITVRFIGAFRGVSGKSKITIKFEEETPLRETIKRIVEKIPELKKVLIDPELEDPRPNTLILVNGKEISVLNGLQTLLKDGDEVVFIPVIHGG